MFDTSVNLGHIIQIGLYLIGLIVLVMVMRRDVTHLAKEIEIMRIEMRRMAEVLIVQARQDERITAIDQRMLNQGRRLDETARRMNTFLDMKSVNRVEDEEG